MEKIQIFDTTLRDGEQSPGCSMSAGEKLLLARQLEKLGVDTIEAGFAASSPGDFESVRSIGQEIRESMVVSLCRMVENDVDRGAEALKDAHNWGLHTFIASSPLHMKHKLQMEPDEVLKATTKCVERAKKYTDNVEFSAEDATRSEPEFLVQLFSEAVRAGAVVLNVPDTVGYTTPDEMYELITRLMNEVYQADQVVFSVHCHNDLGMAVANSMAAVRAGARQIECTINGIGERAGNASLEELVMAINTRQQYYQYETGITTEQIFPSSKLLSQITGVSVQPNKAIVGANAFAHESGIHQDGMLKNAQTYEIMTPESVGLTESKLVMGKHSGRHAFRQKLTELGYDLGDNAIEDAFKRFKDLADLKKDVFDEDIVALVDDAVVRSNDTIQLVSLEVLCGTEHQPPRARLSLNIDGDEVQAETTGDGPVDAIFQAIKDLTSQKPHLQLYQVHAVTEGTDAQAEVTVRLEENGKTVNGQGADTDTMVASARAYINALNKLIIKREKTAPAALSA